MTMSLYRWNGLLYRQTILLYGWNGLCRWSGIEKLLPVCDVCAHISVHVCRAVPVLASANRQWYLLLVRRTSAFDGKASLCVVQSSAKSTNGLTSA